MKSQNIMINGKTKLLRCKNGVAYYTFAVPYSENLYSFPVPLNSIQGDSLAAESHTIYFMDYIRKAIHEGTLSKEAA